MASTRNKEIFLLMPHMNILLIILMILITDLMTHMDMVLTVMDHMDMGSLKLIHKANHL